MYEPEEQRLLTTLCHAIGVSKCIQQERACWKCGDGGAGNAMTGLVRRGRCFITTLAVSF